MEWITVDDVVTHTFCPRKLWLMSRGEKPHTADTVRGLSADSPVSRKMYVENVELGVRGVCDVVDSADGSASLVEYKSTREGKVPVIHPSYLTQLALYRSCLESMGVKVSDASIWFVTQRQKVMVELTRLNEIDVFAAVSAARNVILSEASPAPLEADSAKCAGCSLFDVCQPSPKAVPRDPLGTLLVVDDAVRSVRVRNGKFLVTSVDDETRDVSPGHVSGVLITNQRAAITVPVFALAATQGVSVVIDTPRSVSAYLAPLELLHADTRCRLTTLEPSIAVGLAAEMIRAKVLNQAARIRTDDPVAAKTIRDKARDLNIVKNGEQILGIEGYCADIYFDIFVKCLPEWAALQYPGRVKRGSTDPVNILLNYGYGILKSSVVRTIVACGLDPAAAVLHTPGRNNIPLAYDMMEQFRAPVVDSAIRAMLNKGTVTAKGFTVTRNEDWVMSAKTKQDVARAVITMMKTSHKYVPDSFSMTWERTVEYQVRSLVQFIDGTRPHWRGVYVR